MNRKIVLSIIVPIYNAERFLEENILKIENNNIENDYEIILINDGSTDYSGEICNNLKSKFKNIIVIHTKNNGVSAARNEGINVSNGKYICFIDSDDKFECNISKIIIDIESQPSDIYLYNTYYIENEKTNKREIYKKDITINKFYSLVFGQKINAPWGKIFKSNIIKENKLHFDENLSLGEDYDFLIKYCKYIKKIKILKDCKYYYLINSNGLSNNIKTNIFYQEFILYSNSIEILNNLNNSNIHKYILKNTIFKAYLHKIARYIVILNEKNTFVCNSNSIYSTVL